MHGRKVRWLLNNYSSTAGEIWKIGKVVHETGDFLVILAEGVGSPHISPYVIKRYHEVELA